METLGRRWAQHGPSWSQVGSKLRPRWAMIAPRWRSWAQIDRFWEHVGSILGLFWHKGCMAENLQKLKENVSFLVFCGAWRGAVTRKSCLGAVLRDLGAPFGVLRAIFLKFLRRLARRWAQDERSWGQVGSKLRPRWAMIAPRWRSWAQLGRFWVYFGRILSHGLYSRKPTKT